MTVTGGLDNPQDSDWNLSNHIFLTIILLESHFLDSIMFVWTNWSLGGSIIDTHYTKNTQQQSSGIRFQLRPSRQYQNGQTGSGLVCVQNSLTWHGPSLSNCSRRFSANTMDRHLEISSKTDFCYDSLLSRASYKKLKTKEILANPKREKCKRNGNHTI